MNALKLKRAHHIFGYALLFIGFAYSILNAEAFYETEPNDNIGDEGIITIEADCELNGSLDGSDYGDLWYLMANSSGLLQINYEEAVMYTNSVTVTVFSNPDFYGFGNTVAEITPGNDEQIPLSADLYYTFRIGQYAGMDCSYSLPVIIINNEVPIFPNTALDAYFIEEEFWVDIHAGNASTPVSDLFGVSFVLNYTPTDYLDVVMPAENNRIGGSFIGPDSVFYSNVDESAGRVHIGVSRKYPAAGAYGDGVVARVKFVSNVNTPDQTQCDFTITGVTSNDHNGNGIELTPNMHSVLINAGVDVWPGDTNNDGIVDQEDVLPLGLHWLAAGPARDNASAAWEAERCTPWDPEAATYADANGTGQVDQADLLPIGLNWSKGQSESIPKAVVKPVAEDEGPVTHYFNIGSGLTAGKTDTIKVMVKNLKQLFGNSFVVSVDESSAMEFLSVQAGDVLGDDLVCYSRIDNENGMVCVGMTRKAGQGGVNQEGVLCQFLVRTGVSAETVQFKLMDVTAINPEGERLAIQTQDAAFSVSSTDKKTSESAIIETFRLHQNYPNPFNPSTTIAYDLPRQSHVRLQIFNIEGKLIRTLASGIQPSGFHSAVWDGTDDTNNKVSNGMYFCRLISDERSLQMKIIYIK